MPARRNSCAPPPLSDEDRQLFRDAVAGVRPLPDHGRALLPPRPQHGRLFRPATPAGRASAYVHDRFSDHIPDQAQALESDEHAWAGPGIARQVIRRLRSGHWPVEAELDLHGLRSEEARGQLARFLHQARASGLRCICIIHGKGHGSLNGEAVLKLRVRHWLTQATEVLAWTPAPPRAGGGGAVLALLRAGEQ